MSDIEKNEPRAGVGRAILAVSIVGLVGTVASIWLGGMSTARSVAIGAAIAVGNLWLLAQMVRGFLDRAGSSAPWSVIAVLKFVALFGAMYVLVKTRVVSLLPCVFGFGALPVGIVLAEVFSSRRSPGEG
jgi:hypothetical protein